MPDREKVINGLRSIKTYLASQAIEATDSFAREGFIESQKDIDDALELLKEQEETIRNLEQEIRDKNERLKERAEQVDSMLKEKETVEPICIKKDFVDEFYGYVASCPKCKTLWIMYQDEKMHYCPNCGRSVKWE